MKKRSAFLLVLTGVLLGAATVPSTTSRPATAPATAPAAGTATTSAPALAKSAKDGIYNDEQLARGKKAYFASCARCHGDTLGGNDDAVPLVGKEFLDDWSAKSVGDLEEYTRKQMPSDGPGKLTRREVTDI